ncbi:MAG TPA: SEC-C metal-binding domain-containing protein [Desulfosporosinus sp.]|nr:SEC-C metal-binding domain-containing protein [Desulfosporosinus sp.]
MFSFEKLIRTEINTLLGLMIKAEIKWTLPTPKTIQEYIGESERLLQELHNCLSNEFLKGVTKEEIQNSIAKPFQRGNVLREPIFYSGEAAYNFQYLDFASRKYAADGLWLQAEKGFTIEQASIVAKAIDEIKEVNFDAVRKRLQQQHPDEWTMVPFFAFNVEEVAVKVGLSAELVEKILGAFELGTVERNAGFNTLQDFNIITATPLLRMPNGEFLSLQSYSLAEAIYEAPFYWMVNDKGYLPTLTKNRGDFTESFIADRLGLVFGAKHVYQNIDIIETKADTVSEIDTLVIWANRVIVVQAKSKRLTLEARKGNDQIIRDDFKKAVQAAYDQGSLCAMCLLGNRYKFVTQDGIEVLLPDDIKEIYLFCIVSDHYPALNFQARQFLQPQTIERLQPPLVMDIFAIDAMTEMLQSPIQFLSYINRRAIYDKQLMASQELTILGFHLTNNLWVAPGIDLLHLADDFTSGLDIAMSARRTGIQGAPIPDGVLARFGNTTVGRIVKNIEARPESGTIDLGFLLLGMSEQAVNEMSRVIDRQVERTKVDGKVHDASFSFKESSGITFHCSDEPQYVAGQRLKSYCRQRKYKERAKEWYGLCISSTGADVRFVIALTYPWLSDPTMDESTRDMQAPMPTNRAIQKLFKEGIRAKKVGRNDPCPCGSGLKFKKCCLN